jgi:hypothetical protein
LPTKFTKTHEKNMIVRPGADLVAELQQMGFAKISSPRDRMVLCPSARWLDDFGDWCELNRDPYLKEAWDCDDFALWGVVQAGRALARKYSGFGHAVLYAVVDIAGNGTGGTGGTGGTSGLFGVAGGRHALNLIRCEDGWYWFEPQNGQHAEHGDCWTLIGALDFVLV